MKITNWMSLVAVLSLSAVHAAGPDSTGNGKAFRSGSRSIPYPNRSMYLDKGITGSVGFGYFEAEGQFYRGKAMFQWQGEGSFYYASYLSGGASAKIIAGEPSDSSTQVENRYVGFIRLHKRLSSLAAFLGLFAGLYNLEFSLESAGGELSQKDSGDVNTALFDFGLDIGTGWKFSSPLGITFGTQLEQVTDAPSLFKFVTGKKLAYTESLLRLNPGINLDLLFVFSELRNLCKGAYLSLEMQYAFIHDLENPRRDEEFIIILGGSVAF
jgi:hypothetical protein